MDHYEQFSVEDRTKIVELYFATMSSTLVQRQVKKKIPHHHTITSLVKKKKLRNTESVVNNNKRHCSPRFTAKMPAHVKDARDHLEKSACKNTRHVSHSKWVFPGDLCTKLSTVIWNGFPTKCRLFKCKLKPTRPNATRAYRERPSTSGPSSLQQRGALPFEWACE